VEVTLTIHITPNPNGGRFEIVYTLPGRLSPYEIEIFNILGQVVTEVRGNGGFAGEYRKQLDLSIASGVYFAKIITVDGVATTKFIISK